MNKRLLVVLCVVAALAVGAAGILLMISHGGTTTSPLIITLDQTEHIGSVQLFHFTIQNTSSASETVLGNGDIQQFVLLGTAPPRTPQSQDTLTLRAPEPAYASAHPALATSVGRTGRIDGWLEADLSRFAYQPSEVQYRYATVSSEKCAKPEDRSTCSPATLYVVIPLPLSQMGTPSSAG